ncbi:MAG: hypothetical protein WCI31_00630 [Prolixibacteraceae bacterium]
MLKSKLLAHNFLGIKNLYYGCHRPRFATQGYKTGRANGTYEWRWREPGGLLPVTSIELIRML